MQEFWNIALWNMVCGRSLKGDQQSPLSGLLHKLYFDSLIVFIMLMTGMLGQEPTILDENNYLARS